MSHTSFAHIQNATHEQWWRDPCLRRNVVHCLGISLCVYYLGYDQNLLNGLQAITQWQDFFGRPSAEKLGLATSSIFFSAVPCAFIADFISARYGRKWAIRVGASLIIIGTIVNTLAHDFNMFIGSRWLIGAGGGMTKVCAPALLHEIAHPRLRASLGATYYAFAYVGGILAAWICFGGLYIQSSWSWRFPVLFQAVGPIIVIALLFDIPESPRFLMAHGQDDRALRVLANSHANGKMDDPLVQHEIQEIKAALAAEQANKQTSYLDFLRTPANRRRLFVVCVIAIGTNIVGNSVISYYLAPILRLVGIVKPVEISAINGCLAIWNLIASLTAAQYVDRVGRRPLWLGSTAGMLICFSIVTGLSAGFANTQKSSIGIAVVPFLFLFFGCYCAAWTIMCFSYTTEILPYNMRTKGLAIFVCVQNLFLAANTYVNPIALRNVGWKFYIFFLCTTSTILVIIYFFFPEIKGLTLDEISVVFDAGRLGNKSAARELQQHRAEQEAIEVRDDSKRKDMDAASV